MKKTDTIKLTTTCASLRKGDKIGRAVVRRATLNDAGNGYLVYVEGSETPRRYGLRETITVTEVV